MQEMDYLSFDLRIERAEQGYRARVLASPAGQASADFALPFSDLELENFVLRMSRSRRQSRRIGTPEFEAARAFGGRLYEAVFAGEVRGTLRSSLDAADREGRGLRLRLHLSDAPELIDIPWEYLYSPALNRFFALSNATPLIRYLDLPGRIPALTVQPPLRLVAVIASPKDYPSLDVEQEWIKLRDALKELEDAGLLSVERLQPPTLNALQRRLRAGPGHILHFIGHGAFDDVTQDGVLLMEDETGRGRVISAQDLGVLLRDHHPMRLVVLNACEGARSSRADPFAGAAQSLIQQGIPAVVAMQFEISDQAAIVISHEFYAALAAGYPVDAALSEARKAVFTNESGAEWGTPVLYLRSTDGRIFGMAPRPQPSPPVPAPASEPVAVAPAAVAPAPVAPVAVSPAAVPPAPKAERPPLAKSKILWALAGLAAILALAFGLSRLLPGLAGRAGQEATSATPEATAAGTAPRDTPARASSDAAAGQADIERLLTTQPAVFSSSALVYDLAPADDGIWAATSGGLARWRSDGTNDLFSTADGLPATHQRAILPIQDGVLWTASTGAAAAAVPKDDGLGAVQRFTKADGIEIGEAPVLMRDVDDSVWVASLYRDQPILRYDGSLWRAPDINYDDPALAGVRPQIASLLRTSDGAAWAGLHEDGILRLADGEWTRFGPDQGVPVETISRLLEDSNGALWAAAGDGGLLRFEPDSGQWERVQFQRADAPVYWISQLPDNSLWASGDNFIARSEDTGERWTLVATPDDGLVRPRSAVQDAGGRIWVATDNGVASYEDEQWQRFTRPGELSSYSLGSLYMRQDGKLWVLPEYGGPPSVVDPVSGQVAPLVGWPSELPDVISLAFQDDVVWAGLNDRLIRIEDGAIETWDETDGLPGARINELLLVEDTLWIGGSEGIARLDLDTGQITEHDEATAGQFIDVLALTPDGVVWAGAHRESNDEDAAVYRFAEGDHQAWTTGAPPLERAGAWAHAIAAAEDGGVWVASGTGAYRWDGEAWSGWSSAQGGPTGEVFALMPHDGAMWLAGHSGALDRWDAARGWQRFRPKALTNDVLDMQVSQDGALWLATKDGLLRYGE